MLTTSNDSVSPNILNVFDLDDLNTKAVKELAALKNDQQPDFPKAVVAKYGDSFEPKTENWEELKGDIVFDDVTFCITIMIIMINTPSKINQ